MARAETPTLLSLDQWAQVMGFNPYEFNQIGEGITFSRETQCPTVFYQYTWQHQFLSREEIALAIAQAEHAIAEQIGFYPAPKYFTNETITYPKDWRTESPDFLTARGQWKRVQYRWGYICQLGTQSSTLIQAGAAITTSDPDGDGFDELSTVSVTSSTATADSIKVYFAEADRNGEPIGTKWEIRPIRASKSGNSITITFPTYQSVNPALETVIAPDSLNASGAIFVTTVDVYTEIVDTDNLGTAQWDTVYGHMNINESAISAATITESPLGLVRPQINNCISSGRAPDRLQVNYLAGFPLLNGRVQTPMAQAVTYLSCQYLPALSCGCDRADQKLYFWRSTPTDTEQGRRPMTSEEINENPFGVTRGAIYAWQAVQTMIKPLNLAL